MRNTLINIYEASQDDRIKLYNHLRALGEEIYSDTGLRNTYYSCSQFKYDSSSDSSSSHWVGSGTLKNLSAISINDFIKKFPVHSSKTTIEDPIDYAIICKDSSLVDQKTICSYLTELGHSIYKDTRFNREPYNNYSEASTTVRCDSNEWSTGPSNKKRITATDFINKFIKPVVATPEPILTTTTSEKEPEMDIKVGDVYKNSSGNLNTITGVIHKDLIYYTSSSGNKYSTCLDVIEKNWKKVTETTVQSTTVHKYLNRTVKIGDYVERVKNLSSYNDLTPAFVKKTRNNFEIRLVGSTKGFWDMEFFKVINPKHPSHPNYVASTSRTTIKVLQPLSEYLKTNSIKIGDVLKIRTDLEKHSNVTSKMCTLAGSLVTITATMSVNYGFKFKGDGSNYWDESMFEAIEIEVPVVTTTPTKTITGFKPGDRVKVRSDLTEHKNYKMLNGGGYVVGVNSIMETYAGKIVTIDSINRTGPYYLKECGHNWVDEMFDGLESEQTPTIITLATTPVTVSPSVNTLTSSATIATGTPFGGTKQPTLKSEKKTMAQKIKETAVITLDQNKQAAIIAGKMEAGRILNKQVLKQIKPHIPMFVRGYLDTPLAPVIVANLVAAVGNHTQNKRVQQVSELMLLAAADATVQSFNLDKIIDDVLAGVKLPAGILTSDEE